MAAMFPTTSIAPTSRRLLCLLLGLVYTAQLGLDLSYLEDLEQNSPFIHVLALDPADNYDRALSTVDPNSGFRTEVFYRAPAYPWFLRALSELTGARTPIELVRIQVSFGAITAPLLFLIVRSLVGGLALPFLGTIGWILYGPRLFFFGQLLDEVLLISLLLFLWFLLLVPRDETKPLSCFLPGIVLGLAALTRASMLLCLPLLAFSYWFAKPEDSFRARATASSCLILGTLLVILPVTVRNALVSGGDIVLINASGGANFFLGNNPMATGACAAPPDLVGSSRGREQEQAFRAAARAATGQDMTPSALSSYWWSKGWSFLSREPGSGLSLWGRKLLLAFNHYEVPLNADYTFHRRYSPLFGLAILEFSWLFPLGLIGLLGWYRRQRAWTLTALLFVAQVLPLLLFFVSAKHRFSLSPFFIVYTVIGLAQLIQRARTRSPVIFSAVFLAFAGAGITHLDLLEPQGQDVSLFQEGWRFEVLGNIPAAVRAYHRAFDLNPDNLQALNNLARLLETTSATIGATWWELLYRRAQLSGADQYLRRAEQALSRLQPSAQSQKSPSPESPPRPSQ